MTGRSVRDRLGVAAAVGAMVLVSVAGLLALTQAWSRSNSERVQSVADRLEAVDRALSSGSANDATDLTDDGDEFVALLDRDGGAIDVSPGVNRREVEHLAVIELEVLDLGEFEMAFAELDRPNGTWEAGAVTCSDSSRCSVVVLGRRPVGWWSYFTSRVPAAVAIVLGVGLITYVGSRWLVGRSLKPVDRMRRELDAITAGDLDRRIEANATGDELESLATTMNRTITTLADSIAVQRRFVSDSAHELRSPLTGIRATLELAQDDPDRQREAIEASIVQVDRTAKIVDDLLVLARQDGGPHGRRDVADVDDIVRGEIAGLQFRHPDIAIDRNAIEPVQTSVDPSAIGRLARNLLDNAASYGDGMVRVSLRSGFGSWMLTVEDDGPGVPPEGRTMIFERFGRLDQSRSRDTGGTGLGLAIAAGIVGDHHGSITLDESDLGGARFRVEIPMNPKRGPAQESTTALDVAPRSGL